jgi:hypothetical protein
MPSYAYLDASAIVKLAVIEAETAALETDAASRDGLLSSRLGATEARRAARRAGNRRVIHQIDEVLESLVLVELTPAIVSRAGLVGPPEMRTLDALHLATALSLTLPSLDFITYDRRLASAAAAAGLRVAQPGRGVRLEA